MSSRSAPAEVPAPVLRVTQYEQVSGMLLAISGGLACVVFLLGFIWYSSRVPKPKEPVPVELFEDPGGVEDGSPDETLRVDSPEPPAPDAATGDVVSEERDIQESLDDVVKLADDAVVEVQQRAPDLGVRNAAKPGSADGTGRRALGSGPGSGGGFSREQRWYVRFGDQANLDEYARQLDFFGIEFGAIVDGRMVYLSKMAGARPIVRTAAGGANEKRLYMTWQGGGRKQADLQIFRKAGIEVGAGLIFHFYPKETEDRLARLELAYRNRAAREIRRTYFSVNPADGGYEFSVAHQTYLK